MPNIYLPGPKHKPVEVPLGLKDGRAVVRHAVREYRGGVEDLVVESLARCAASITETAERVAKGNDVIMADATNTEVTNAKRARDTTQKSLDDSAKKIDSTYAGAKRTLDELLRKSQPPRPTTTLDAVYASEIHTLLRGMSPADRMAALSAALDDSRFIGAALDGNSILSGLTQAEKDAVREQWRRRHHAETVGRIEMLDKAMSAFRRTSELLIRWGQDLHADKEASIAAAERSAELAREAMQNAAGE